MRTHIHTHTHTTKYFKLFFFYVKYELVFLGKIFALAYIVVVCLLNVHMHESMLELILVNLAIGVNG